MKNKTFKTDNKSQSFFVQFFSLILLVLLVFPIVPAARNPGKNTNIQSKAETESQLINETTKTPVSDNLAPAVSFSNTAPISIPDNGSATPSSINVSGLSGTITKVTVTLNNISHSTDARDLDFLLVSPDNKKFNFLSDRGGGDPVSNVTLTLDDTAVAGQVPNSGGFTTGTFQPADTNSFGAGDGNDSFPFAPAGPQLSAAPEGASTFGSVFNGINPNGNWVLHAIDDAPQSSVQSVAGGWSIDITVSATAVATTTNITSGTNPSFTGNAVTFTAAVTSTSTVNEGTVTFTENGGTISGCGAVNVVAGSAQCSPTFATEGTRTIQANYNGTANFNSSNDNLSQEVNNATTVNGNEFSNTGQITLDDSAGTNATPYPSKIFVTGLGGTISKVTLTLNNMTLFDTRETDILLVGPNGEKFLILADVGDSANTTNATIILDDTAVLSLPNSGGLVNGTFKPTDYVSGLEPGGDMLAPPAPAPPYNQPAPTATSTFASVFNGISPNGTWQLFAEDESQLGGADGFIAGGWCLTFTTTNDAPTTTTLSSTPNPAFITQAIGFTATVTSGGNPVTTGTVNFREGANVLASNVALNASGQATYNAPAATFPEGSHQITADYSGDPGNFNTSNDTITQIVNELTTTVGASFCNPGAITADDSADTTTPYPSNIFVSGLIGNFQSVTITLNDLTTEDTRDMDFLLVGPNGEKFLILSDTGDASSTTNATITLDDAAGSQLPNTGGLSNGTFRPTSYVSGLAGNDDFPAPAPSPPYNIAAPEGSATFASVFPVGTNPNGMWSLYMRDDSISGGADPTLAGGWCVTPILTPTSTTTGQVQSSQNPAATTQNITFSTTVTAPAGTPTGMVEFFEDGNSLGTASLTPVSPLAGNVAPSGSAQAQLMTNFMFGRNRNITATYNGVAQPGGGGFATSNSNANPLVQVVIGPTAANVTISGRATSANGRGIFMAHLTMVDSKGQTRYAITNPFGYYRFVDVQAGQTYILSIGVKNKTFNSSTRVINVDEDLTGINFTSEN